MNPAAGSLVAPVADADVAVPRAAAPVSRGGTIFSAALPGAAFATPAPVSSGVPAVLAVSSGLLALTGITGPQGGAPGPVPPAGNPLQTALLGLGARRGAIAPAASVVPGPSASAAGLLVNPAVGGVGPAVPKQGPVVAALCALFREIRYQLFDQRPTATPSQLQGTTSPEEGTLNVWDPDGDPMTFTVTAAPEHGTVNLDADGFYVYTPGADLARTGGTDSFTVRVADAGFHLQTLFGLPARGTTVTVPVTVARPLFGLGNSAPVYTLHNTTAVAVQIAGYTVNGSTVYPEVGTVLSPAGTDGDTALFEIPAGAQVTMSLNPVGVTHYGAVRAISATPGVPGGALAVSADGVKAYVASSSDGGVAVIDTVIEAVTTTIPIPGNDIESDVLDVAVSPDGTRVYAFSRNFGASPQNSSVSVIDTRPASPAYNQVISTIDVGAPDYAYAKRLAVSPDGARVYVLVLDSVGDGTVSVIDTTTNTVVGSPITVGNAPRNMVVSRDGARVYVTNTGDGNVSVIDTTTNTAVGAPISVGGIPYAATISPDGARLYVIASENNQGKVWVIATATDTVVGSPIAFGTTVPTGLILANADAVVSPDGKRLYVANAYASSDPLLNGDFGFVSVIDINPASPTHKTEIGGVDTGEGSFVAVSADGTLYALYPDDATLQVLNVDRTGSDGGTAQYTVTLGRGEGCASTSSAICKVSGNDAYLMDTPGTVVTVPISQAQRQSDTLGNLCVKTDSNCTFRYDATKKSQQGFSDPTFPAGFTIFSNETTSSSNSNYAVSTTATTTSSWQYALNVSASAGVKFDDFINATVSSSYTTTTGNSVANSQTFNQSTTQTVKPGETLFLYMATPVTRFYGDWTVRYGNTTYSLTDVWFDIPTTGGTAQIVAYTCTTDCTDLRKGTLPTDSAGDPLGFGPSIYSTKKV